MFLQQLINGLTIGSTYALVAIGFSMVFGVIKLTNFANGSLYMLGAYLSLMLYLLTGNFVVAFLLSLILTGTAGYCLERFALRYLRKKHAPNLSALITTLDGRQLDGIAIHGHLFVVIINLKAAALINLSVRLLV